MDLGNRFLRHERLLRWTVYLVLVSLPTLFVVGAVQATPRTASPFRNLELFSQALVQIENEYVDPADQDALVRGAIRGMVESLDPHSTYLDPDEYRLMMTDMQGRFAGVGVEVSSRDGWLTVLSVFEGGPAASAGLRPGDRFLHLDGKRARDMRIEDAVRLIRGEPGTAVRVAIRRDGELEAIELSLTRAVIEIPAIRAERLADGVLYLRIAGFSEKTAIELRQELDRAARRRKGEEPVRGVLIDLRDNGGGLLDQAILVADEFLEEGVIVTARGRKGELMTEARAQRDGYEPSWPIVVLVNQFSASASEIVAGALRDHGRALLVGTRTWGKGSVQKIYPLPDGSAVKLTIARYYTPSGRSIQAQGIEPDRIVDPPKKEGEPDDLESYREARLPRHLQAGAPQPSAVARRTLPVAGPIAAREGLAKTLPERFREDPQVLAGVEELRSMMGARL